MFNIVLQTVKFSHVNISDSSTFLHPSHSAVTSLFNPCLRNCHCLDVITQSQRGQAPCNPTPLLPCRGGAVGLNDGDSLRRSRRLLLCMPGLAEINYSSLVAALLRGQRERMFQIRIRRRFLTVCVCVCLYL